MPRLPIAAMMLLFVGTASAQPRGPAGAFGWHTDYAAGKAEAKRTGKPIFLVFRCEP